MTQIIGITVISLLFALIFKSVNPSFSIIIAVCAACILFFKVADSLAGIIESFKNLASGFENVNNYVHLMLKTLGIAMISQFIADICRDSGESALAGQTEVVTKIIIIAMIMPLFEAVIKAVSGLLI